MNVARLGARDWRYLGYFYLSAAAGVLRPQRLRLPKVKTVTKGSFCFSESLERDWGRLFGVVPGAPQISFTYQWRVHEVHFLRLMNQLGFNYRNVLHLSHRREFSAPQEKLEPGTEYLAEIALDDVVWLSRDRAVLINRGILRAPDGRPLTTTTDWLFLKGLADATVAELKGSPLYNHADVSEFRALSRRLPTLTDPGSGRGERVFTVSPTLGIDYGLVSGDLNPLHTSTLLARAFGYPRPFLQGVATANALYKIFSHDLGETLLAIQTTFSHPLYLGQQALLRYDASAFELFDRERRLVAFGRRETKAPPTGSPKPT